jgi:hypothetical protein
MLTENIWVCLVDRLESISNEGVKRRRFSGSIRGQRFDCAIINSFPSVFHEFEGRRFQLLWRESRDGFQSSFFHNKCDLRSHTVTLVLTTKGFIFGGYTPVAWNRMCGYKADHSLKSFVFTLKNPHQVPACKVSLKSDHKDYAIYFRS